MLWLGETAVFQYIESIWSESVDFCVLSRYLYIETPFAENSSAQRVQAWVPFAHSTWVCEGSHPPAKV